MKLSLLGKILALSLMVTLVACSSNKAKEDDTDIIPAATDAGTDAVPQPATEAPPIPETPISPEPPQAGNPTPPSDLGPVSSPAQSENTAVSESYTVQKGDTLMKIAFETQGDVYKWREIYEANKDKLKDPNSIPSGVVLKIEKSTSPVGLDRNGERYLIKQGDTLGKISNELYGTEKKWKDIWENNKKLIKNPNRIFAGFYLYYVPAGGAASSQATSQESSGNAGAVGSSGSAGNGALSPPALPSSLMDPNAGNAAPPSSGAAANPENAAPAAAAVPPDASAGTPPPPAEGKPQP